MLLFFTYFIISFKKIGAGLAQHQSGLGRVNEDDEEDDDDDSTFNGGMSRLTLDNEDEDDDDLTYDTMTEMSAQSGFKSKYQGRGKSTRFVPEISSIMRETRTSSSSKKEKSMGSQVLVYHTFLMFGRTRDPRRL